MEKVIISKHVPCINQTSLKTEYSDFGEKSFYTPVRIPLSILLLEESWRPGHHTFSTIGQLLHSKLYFNQLNIVI